MPRTNPSFGHVEAKDSLLNDGLWDVYNKFHMGNCAENTAKKYGISREDLDGHATESYKRAAKAWSAGAFDAEIAPVTIKDRKGETVIKEDEEYKKVMFDKIPTLKPAFTKDGVVTAANASNLNDGGSALILMTAAKAQELGVKPLAKIVCECTWRGPFQQGLTVLRLLSLRGRRHRPHRLPYRSDCGHASRSREGWPEARGHLRLRAQRGVLCSHQGHRKDPRHPR